MSYPLVLHTYLITAFQHRMMQSSIYLNNWSRCLFKLCLFNWVESYSAWPILWLFALLINLYLTSVLFFSLFWLRFTTNSFFSLVLFHFPFRTSQYLPVRFLHFVINLFSPPIFFSAMNKDILISSQSLFSRFEDHRETIQWRTALEEARKYMRVRHEKLNKRDLFSNK